MKNIVINRLVAATAIVVAVIPAAAFAITYQYGVDKENIDIDVPGGYLDYVPSAVHQIIEEPEGSDCTNDDAVGGTDTTASSNGVLCVNSGAYLSRGDRTTGRFETLQGARPALPDNYRDRYDASSSNIADTNNGAFPQNLFRMFIRERFTNIKVSAQFQIINDNFVTNSGHHRGGDNGILIMARMNHNGNDDGYYGGIRVDGQCVIKKKIDDTYQPGGGLDIRTINTTTFNNVVDGSIGSYLVSDISSGDNSRANLLKRGHWFNLGFEAKNVTHNSQDSVRLRVYLSNSWSSTPAVVCEAYDDSPDTFTADGDYSSHSPGQGVPEADSAVYGTTSLFATGADWQNQGQWGIRTDFMDVMFDELVVEPAGP